MESAGWICPYCSAADSAAETPQGAARRCGSCSFVLPAQGSTIDSGPLMGDDASRFVFAVPGLRGETLEVDGEAYVSEGDRTDGWDGATDDTIALLSAVLEAVPEAHPERACVYGKSRGASVALLAAARDPRIDCAVAWAGPADWFRLMGTWGWTLLSMVWGLAILGIVLKATRGFAHPALSTGLYVGMGWLAVVAAKPLMLNVPAWGLFWLLAGGLAYTAGVGFFAAPRLRYGHFVWHLFVAMGTGCHFIAVSRSAT